MVKKMGLTKIIAGLFGALLLFHVIATQKFWYWAYPWLDVPMHILGGVWVALFFAWLTKRYPALGFSYGQANLWGGFLMTLGFVALFGVGWEFYEFIYDIFFSLSRDYRFLLQLSAADTVADLFFDLLGGTLGFLIAYFFVTEDTVS